MNAPTPYWDCRWPDPVALQVASERILQSRAPDDPNLNRRLTIRVQMVPPELPTEPTRALLVTPWAVERIYWHNTAQADPPVRHAAPLTPDAEGRVAAGLGVILEYATLRVPVLTAWEPEVGHHFVETLLPSVRDCLSGDEALAIALGQKPLYPPKRSVTDHLTRPVSRRSLFGIFGR